MMRTSPIKLKNIPLKLSSLIVAYVVWNILSQEVYVQHTIDVPVCIYNSQTKYKAPQTVTITVSGPRHAVQQLTYESPTCALHINGAQLKNTQQWLSVDDGKLFLPENVHVVHCSPHLFSVELFNTV